MILIIFFLLMGWLGAFLAEKAGRNQALWFLIVGLTGGWGLLLLGAACLIEYGKTKD